MLSEIFSADSLVTGLPVLAAQFKAQKAGAVVEATDELPKSFLVVSEYGENRVILTKYNAAVLLKRMQDAQRTPISAKGEAI